MIPLPVPLLLGPAGDTLGAPPVIDVEGVDGDGADITIELGEGLLLMWLTTRSRSIPRRFGLLQF